MPENVQTEQPAAVNHEAEFLEKCRRIYQRWNGDPTPAEDFIISLVTVHDARGLIPADVEDELREFRENFDDMLEAVRYGLARYPHLTDPNWKEEE